MKNAERLIFTFVLCIMCVIPTLVLARTMDSRDIEMRAKKGEGSELRSIIPVRAWVDGKTVYVSFLENPEVAQITIVSKDSSFLIEEVYSSPQTISIPLESSGTFQIEIDYEEKAFVGNFVLNL